MAAILIMDPHEGTRSFLVKLLGWVEGHAVTEAVCVDEALCKAALQDPDVLICDLPSESDGPALLRLLRLEPALAETPVVFFCTGISSANAGELDRISASVFLVSKPNRPGVLLQAVKKALAARLSPESVEPGAT